MTCIRIPNGIMCVNRSYRLRLVDGRHVFLEWHPMCGPAIYRDRYLSREMDRWWEDAMIVGAVNWFQGRGCLA